VRREVRVDRREQVPALLVDRGHAVEVVVVLGHLEQALLGHATTARHIAQERHHVVGVLGAAEGEQEKRVIRHPAILSRPAG
jgi:hypothetical protein